MSLVRKLAVALAAALLVVPVAAIAAGDPSPTAEENAQVTKVQLLALNDFHGNLRPPDGITSSGGRIGSLTGGQCLAPTCYLAGGVEYLATHVRSLEATNPNTLFVSAGDLIGATPLISAAFHDEPTIEAFNLMGLDYNGVGNHEFDEGVTELLRMQNGGCHPVDGCFGGDGFAGADFDFLAANVKYKSSGETILPPYAIHHFQGVKVGIIGMTLEGTPSVVTQEGIASVDFFDEADTVNKLVPILKRQNVETIVVLVHEGGSTSNSNGTSTVAAINQCNPLSGAIPPIVEAMDDEVDVVVTGHTNWAVNCVIDGKVVTGAAHQSRLVTDIDLTISRATKDVIASETKVNNVIVTRDVAKAPDLTALVDKYGTLAAPIENRVIGNTQVAISRTAAPSGESVLGNLIADAQLWATQSVPGGPAQIAFMNAGGIRADINPGEITYGEAFSVQPFANILVTMNMTGAQIKQVLQQQFTGSPLGIGILQVSSGLTYTRTAVPPAPAPPGQAGDLLSNVRLNGQLLGDATVYRVTVNNFLADGGDNYFAFQQGTDRYKGEIDLDAFARYLEANNPVTPPALGRITYVP